MASQQDVRQYLSYWFQLGKRLVIANSGETLLPQPVIRGDRYSNEFEECWRRIMAPDIGECYLEGTDQTIAQLLSPAWDVSPCARCAMPIPMPNLGVQEPSCPCSDLPLWPNSEVPPPRSPISSQEQLTRIRNRLLQTKPQS